MRQFAVIKCSKAETRIKCEVAWRVTTADITGISRQLADERYVSVSKFHHVGQLAPLVDGMIRQICDTT